ncbi:hypothetical protein QJS10_CPB22g00352 [Acorus calamus]|uniref:RNA-directed DNA polymerase, eukaryota, Reverse transcriptase zinc-binding domain protein n=1 Tax=Acorus calamus TaxID=4465 RepID=A0AAV9C2M3_ACOCL|nr:hypothetical protein QJS10_CPB22g00352 [Acorus calamus]
MDWLDKSFPIGVPRDIMRVVFVVTLWAIWKERCQRHFRSKETHKRQVLQSIKKNVQMNFQGKILKEDWCSTIQELGDNWGTVIHPVDTLKTLVSWLPLEDGWVKANSDGSLSADRAGYRAVL